MKEPAKGYGSYGPSPWQQTSWDARAAGNFIGGGMGGSLIVFAALSGATGPALSALVLSGLGLVGLGLLCVALELGRPLRAIRVLRNPRTSWMAREAWTAMLLFPVGLAAAAGATGLPGSPPRSRWFSSTARRGWCRPRRASRHGASRCCGPCS